MIVRSAGDDAVTVLSHACSERSCIDHHLALIIAKLRLQSFVETYRFGSDHVHEGSALNARKNGGVNLFGEFFFAHDDAAARSAQTFVCRGGDKLRMRNWAGMLTAGHKPGDVRHVDEQNRAY